MLPPPARVSGITPTPEGLKYRILLKGHAGSHDVEEVDEQGKAHSHKQDVAPELGKLIFLTGASFKGFENHRTDSAG